VKDSREKKGLLGVLSVDKQSSEALYGIILTLTTTASLRVVAGQNIDARGLFAATLTTSIAWGFVDAVMYLINVLLARARERKVLDDLRQAPTEEAFRELLRGTTSKDVVDHVKPKVMAHLRGFLAEQPERAKPGLRRRDYGAALMIWLVVCGIALPVAVPFLLFDSPRTAVRVSQVAAIVIMFVLGMRLGHWTGKNPVIAGVISAAVGMLIAVACLALGG
jgi:uncharacterized membrane protein YdcZ (DUF606 family)